MAWKSCGLKENSHWLGHVPPTSIYLTFCLMPFSTPPLTGLPAEASLQLFLHQMPDRLLSPPRFIPASCLLPHPPQPYPVVWWVIPGQPHSLPGKDKLVPSQPQHVLAGSIKWLSWLSADIWRRKEWLSLLQLVRLDGLLVHNRNLWGWIWTAKYVWDKDAVIPFRW